MLNPTIIAYPIFCPTSLIHSVFPLDRLAASICILYKALHNLKVDCLGVSNVFFCCKQYLSACTNFSVATPKIIQKSLAV